MARMLLLLEHYRIDANSPNRWFFLALALASDHVQGFAIVPSYRGRGRSKKSKNIVPKPKKARGRPRKHTDADAVELVRSVEKLKKQLKKKRGGRVTDKETLRCIITTYAEDNKISITKTLATELPRYQKKLSEARRRIRENLKK